MRRQPVDQAVPRSLAGWHNRLEPFPGGKKNFKPKRKDLAFVQLRNAKGESRGFTAAFFAPNVVADARGVVSTLSQEDWQGLVDVAKRAVTETPQAGGLRNQWRIKRERTCYPIEWLRVATGPEGEAWKDVSVYGFGGKSFQLQRRVGNITTLPVELREVFSLVGEARDGYIIGNEDQGVIKRVKGILPRESD